MNLKMMKMMKIKWRWMMTKLLNNLYLCSLYLWNNMLRFSYLVLFLLSTCELLFPYLLSSLSFIILISKICPIYDS